VAVSLDAVVLFSAAGFSVDADDLSPPPFSDSSAFFRDAEG
jgi:hypothetical protein